MTSGLLHDATRGTVSDQEAAWAVVAAGAGRTFVGE